MNKYELLEKAKVGDHLWLGVLLFTAPALMMLMWDHGIAEWWGLPEVTYWQMWFSVLFLGGVGTALRGDRLSYIVVSRLRNERIKKAE